ncbi:FUSC family protein [Erwiniaceae bacterium L1_54_6]|nr:FUSC family protein [Erwiniaceae bacterium L1_54_6]
MMHFQTMRNDWQIPPAHLLFSLQVIVAVLLTVLISDASGMTYPGWAALSSFAVMKNTTVDSLVRAIQRVLGTLAGGSLALILLPLVAHNPIALTLLSALTGGMTVWLANGSAFSYAWVLGGVTAIMVMAEAQHTFDIHHLQIFIGARVAEVTLGCSLCVLTHLLFKSLQRFRGKFAPAAAVKLPGHKEALKARMRIMLAFQGGVTITLVTALLLTFNLAGFWQAIITVLALLTLPEGVTDTNQQVVSRMKQRLLGCLTAALLSLVMMPVLQGRPILYLMTLIVGLGVGCILQQGTKASYFGRQFTVAWLIVYIQDEVWRTEPSTAATRVASIIIGIVLLALTMSLSARFLRSAAS